MRARKFFWFFSLVVSLIFLNLSQGWTQPKSGGNAPVITHSFAIEKGRYGDVLKIFIEADDLDGDMLRIATVAYRNGSPRHPTDWVYLKPQFQRHFIGYLQWNTFGSRGERIREWTEITLGVSVFDKAGNESDVVIFPFEFVSEVIRHPQPDAPFNEGNIPRLGYININVGGGSESEGH